ncbi:MAG: molybdate ABC transporter substrate-binding protein [Candidatus Nealsonbacteria bacterium]|nr:molybdate ABC transporter substrate-binding protein [Candidatus Nealsonbacteria bacterium]
MHAINRSMSVALLAGLMLCSAGPAMSQDGSQKKAEPTYQKQAEIYVLCGTSFRSPMEEIIKQYKKASGSSVLMVFGGSEDHLPKVKLKATGDVYVTHTPYMQYTKEADALLREVPVGYLAPVLVTRKGNPKKLKKFDDLAQPGLRVVLPNPKYSTCGEMVEKLLRKKGIEAAVMKNVGNDLVRHHSIVGNHVKLGARDAGIMWNGVANGFRDSIQIVSIPYEYEAEIRVAVMGLSYTKNRKAVEQFLDFVEQRGKKVFAEFGYVK